MSASADATRQYWVATAERLARPVLNGLAERTLHARMPVESRPGVDRSKVSNLEALGRLLAGLAPWLELCDSASQPLRSLRYLLEKLLTVSGLRPPGGHSSSSRK